MKLTTAIAVFVALAGSIDAFAPLASCGRFTSIATGSQRARQFTLFSTDNSIQDDDGSDLTDDESAMISDIYNRADGNDAILQELVVQALPTMSAKLIMKLKQQQQGDARRVANALQLVLDDRLASGREVLATLLAAGELRKLDSEIGKACRAGKLDMGFFTVLDMNMRDAAMEDQAPPKEGEASRFSILKHIYTRCQEEAEKLVPPGVALLNKLLRTDQDSIRANQMQHYLCPQPNVITLPDGQKIPVPDADQNKVLVQHTELIDAISSAIQQIRTVERAGGIEREAAANMVEACRTVAKEARIVIGQNYGVESEEMQKFEDSLQPVFRPESPESPYIKGQESLAQ